MASEQINIGPLLVILVLSGLIVKFLFFSPSHQSQRTDPQASFRAREEAAQRILQIFPHLDQRSVLWDLQRTGNNVEETTERILSGRIQTPPITFQPPAPPQSTTAATESATASKNNSSSPPQPDLITKYNLHKRLGLGQGAENAGESEKSKTKTWSSSKTERQAALQRRREEMILNARRKMEAKLASEKSAAAEAK